MTYSKEQRRRIAQGFRMAKKYLSPTKYDDGGKREFICHALALAEYWGEIAYSTGTLCREIIRQRLGLHSQFTDIHTYICWLEKIAGIHHGVIADDHENNDGRKAQAGRKAWLESLIKEFSS